MSDEAELATSLSRQEEGGDAREDVVTPFDRVMRGDLPATWVYEDERCVAFRDISPVAPTHVLVVPRDRDGLHRLSSMQERHEATVGHLVHVATKVAKQEGLEGGYRLVINDGPQGCQSVYHLHVHLIGGKQLGWPPGTS